MTISATVVWKYLRSFTKRDWSASDYPIRIRQFARGSESVGRLKSVRVEATVVNWWQMTGGGETRAEALADLGVHISALKATGKRLPRPGTGLPLELASSSRIDAHGPLAADFLKRILGLDITQCFISDESSLWHFHVDDDNASLYSKIMSIYGVDVSDIEGARISDILDRLAAHARD